MLHIPRTHDRKTSPALTLAVALGAILCVFVTLPFLAALVWSVTLAVLFAPLEARIRLQFKFPGISAAINVAITASIVVVPAILVAGTLLNEAGRSAGMVDPTFAAGGWTHLISRT